jgi:hypothetical protein
MVQVGRGRPRRACSRECYRGLRAWDRNAWYREYVSGLSSWWVGLTHEQREKAMDWVDANPREFKGVGRHEWAFLNRKEWGG